LFFADPKYLTALAAVPLLAVLMALVALRKRRLAGRMGDAPLLRALSASRSGDRRAMKAALVLAALACAVIGAARPQAGWQLTRGTAKGIDVVVALDVSASMLAEDVKPNRLERAKAELSALISSLEGSRIAIVAFSGSAAPVCPLTADSRAASMFLDALRAGAVETPGTDIGVALERALRSFDPKEDRSRAVVVVTDGEDHEGGYEEAAARAAEAGVPVYCVGVGGDEGVPIPLESGGAKKGFRRDASGEIVLTRLDRRVLEEVAAATRGSMHVIGPGGGTLAELAKELKSLPARERPTAYTHREERFVTAAILALCLLALDVFVGERRGRAAAVVLALAIAAPAAKASPQGEAAGLYEKGDYAGALAGFRELLEENPSAPLHYNVGNSLYKLGKYDEALGSYRRALEGRGGELAESAVYNMGNCLFMKGDLEGAIEQYKKALKINPNDEDAKHNLELALRRLQENRAQPQSGGGEKAPREGGEEESRGEAAGEDGKREQSREEAGGTEREPREGRQSGEEEGSPAGGPERRAPQVGAGTRRFTPEEAERLLEALGGNEKDLIAKRLRAHVRRKGVKKDW